MDHPKLKTNNYDAHFHRYRLTLISLQLTLYHILIFLELEKEELIEPRLNLNYLYIGRNEPKCYELYKD